MAQVRYQQIAQIGNQRLNVERHENCFEDWTWRTVKLVGFFIGAIAMLFAIFWLGSWFGGRTPTPATPVVTTTTPSTPSAPAGLPTVIKAEPIKVETVIRPSPPTPTGGPSLSKKSDLPPRAW